MRNIWIVLRHEFVTTLSQVSFWVMTFLFPLVVVLLTFGSQWIAQSAGQSSSSPSSGTASSSGSTQWYSFIDQARLIKNIPGDVSETMLRRFPDEPSARAAIQAGEIDWYALIPADYLQSGRLIIVQRSFNPLGDTPERFFQYLLAYNLTGDSNLAAVISNPNPSTVIHNLAPKTEAPDSQISGPMRMMLPYATLFILFMLITTSSGLMLRSVSKEKSSRMAEVLLLSIGPRELMSGKLLGLTLVALLQMLVWAGGSVLFLQQGRSLISGLAQVHLPPGFLAWVMIFFLLGYLMYASLMGAIGTLAPDLREAGQFTFIVIVPLILPMLLYTTFSDAPNGTVATLLSMFPLTAPTAMVTRLASAPVPFWQATASLAGLAITAYLLVLLSARFFRPANLLSTSALKWNVVLAELKQAFSW